MIAHITHTNSSYAEKKIKKDLLESRRKHILILAANSLAYQIFKITVTLNKFEVVQKICETFIT
jgi:hypothetical protein